MNGIAVQSFYKMSVSFFLNPKELMMKELRQLRQLILKYAVKNQVGQSNHFCNISALSQSPITFKASGEKVSSSFPYSATVQVLHC